jgi:hypothetical protein
VLGNSATTSAEKVRLFALIVLGVTDSLASGYLNASDSVRLLFKAHNCLYVRRSLRNKAADEIMGRGVQLPDLFDALSPDESHREFQRELGAVRELCRKLLDRGRRAA